jgi:hypothetical protein
LILIFIFNMPPFPLLASRRPRATAGALVLASSIAAFACGDDGGGPPDQPGEGGVYAIMYEIFDDVGSNSYLSLFDSLDIDAIDPDTAIEFPGGRAFLRAYQGWLFIGEPTSPTVKRYAVSEEGELVDEVRISFANYGLPAGQIDEWGLTFVSPTKAYLFDFESGTTIVWNPTTMEIVGDIPPPAEFLREGWTLTGSPAVVRGDTLFRAIFWANFDTVEYSAEQLLARYDLEDDAYLGSTVETRCPAPENRVHEDEAGNFYFSNWIWTIAGTLMSGRAESCVLKLPVDSDEFDPDWALSYAGLSDGHEGGMFTYLGGEEGLVAIFDDSRITFDDTTDPWEYMSTDNWQIWRVDTADGTGEPIDGIPYNQGAYTPVTIDGRTFLMVPSEGWSQMNLYELVGETAVPSIEVPGWSFALVKVRD